MPWPIYDARLINAIDESRCDASRCSHVKLMSDSCRTSQCVMSPLRISHDAAALTATHRTCIHTIKSHRTHFAAHCGTLQQNTTHCNKIQRTAKHCTCIHAIESHQTHLAAYCSTLQQTTTHGNILHLHTCQCIPLDLPLQALNRYCVTRISHGTHTSWAHCNALQHTATHCDTLQHITTHCNALQHTATHCNTVRIGHGTHTSWAQYDALQRTATHYNTLQHTVTHCNALQCTAMHCNTVRRRTQTHWVRISHGTHTSWVHYNALQRTATHCNTLQRTATHYKTLQRTATHTATHCKCIEPVLRGMTRSYVCYDSPRIHIFTCPYHIHVCILCICTYIYT